MKIKMLQSTLFATAFMAMSLFGGDKDIVPAPAPYDDKIELTDVDATLLQHKDLQNDFMHNISIDIEIDKNNPSTHKVAITPSDVTTNPAIWKKIIPFDTTGLSIVLERKKGYFMPFYSYGESNKDIQKYYAKNYFKLLREEFDRQHQK